MPRIDRLLVANRGEIARRVFRSARALGMSTVAVYSDADAGMPFVREADLAVRLPGRSASETYLREDAILAAAVATGAGGIHPGYGFLSENAGFARACRDGGLVFVGPPPEAIEAVASKLAAKDLMSSRGIPVLPGGVVEDAGDVIALANEHGWPLLLKAAFGGGGRGMRALWGADEAAAALEATRREAESAFSDGTIFAERLVTTPRHIEVQVVADSHGAVSHLFERECSIQRRYQKVIEECPMVGATSELRARLGEAAVEAARAIGYEGAGTVEFVTEPDGGWFFIEVNTRLQVEHPVTEAVTGVDLVALQLRIAEGARLPDEVLQASIRGHAIEARLYAEDVRNGFLPAAGRLDRFELRPRQGIRIDSGVETGSVVSPYYDAMLAKVIAWAPTRAEAARRLADTLAGARIHGLATNRDLLVGTLRNGEFLAGPTDTTFFERNDPAGIASAGGGGPDRRWIRVAVHAAASALSAQAERRAQAGVQPAIPSGWRNVPSSPQRVRYRPANSSEGGDLEVTYRVDADGSARATVRAMAPAGRLFAEHPPSAGAARVPAGDVPAGGVAAGDVPAGDVPAGDVPAGDVSVTVLYSTAIGAIVEIGPAASGRPSTATVRVEVEVARNGESIYLDSALGHDHLVERPRFSPARPATGGGSLVAPMPGTIVGVLVKAGDAVKKGHVLVTLEAMKMEHAVRSPFDGTAGDPAVREGEQVEAGTPLIVIEPDSP